MQTKTTEEQRYQGIGVSPGVAHGSIYVYRVADEVVPEYDLRTDKVADEITRFHQPYAASRVLNRVAGQDPTRTQLHEIQDHIATGTGSAAPSSIIDVHLSLTEDPALIEPVTARVAAEKKNVEYIFNDVASKYTKTLSELSDEYFRERAREFSDEPPPGPPPASTAIM